MGSLEGLPHEQLDFGEFHVGAGEEVEVELVGVLSMDAAESLAEGDSIFVGEFP